MQCPAAAFLGCEVLLVFLLFLRRFLRGSPSLARRACFPWPALTDFCIANFVVCCTRPLFWPASLLRFLRCFAIRPLPLRGLQGHCDILVNLDGPLFEGGIVVFKLVFVDFGEEIRILIGSVAVIVISALIVLSRLDRSSPRPNLGISVGHGRLLSRLVLVD